MRSTVFEVLSFFFVVPLGGVVEGYCVTDDQYDDWEEVEPDGDVQLAVQLVDDELDIGIDGSLVEVADCHGVRPVNLEGGSSIEKHSLSCNQVHHLLLLVLLHSFEPFLL